MNPFIIAVILMVVLFIIGWLGLTIKPRPFAKKKFSQTETTTISLPEGLPSPVEKLYKTVYGEQIPVIETVVITGRGRMRPFGIWLPVRFIMVHQAGKNYRHYFETTFFGIPFLKINEGYIDGKSFFESPMGTYYDDPNTNQGANLALWAEAGWFPALWVTDPRSRWKPVDDHTAVLFVPFQDQEESFIVRFNPYSNRIDLMESMRFKTPKDQNKVLWITNEVHMDNQPSVSYATWLDAGKPWASFTLEDIQFNMDVSTYIRARGQ